jgi:8-oxo-dGTP pyrophosphatase MutT (NUDIX family)
MEKFRRERSPEKELEKPRDVVRAFIVQSKSVDRLQRELSEVTDFQNLFLTKVVFAEKSAKSEKNAGQLIPVGGKVDAKDKTPERAILREMLEETHLRPTKLKACAQDLDYTLKTPEKDILIAQKFFIVDILPSDYAYPIDPEEDKIRQFHGLDLAQLGELFGRGEIENDGSLVTLLGNLRLPIDEVEQDSSVVLAEEKKDIPFEIFTELSEELWKKEWRKREHVLSILFSTLEVEEEQVIEWMSQFKNAKTFFDFQILWRECLLSLEEKPDFEKHFLAAVDLSNFSEETEKNLPAESQVESIIRFMYTLLNTRFDFDDYFEIAEQNPKLSDFVSKIRKFIDSVSSEKNGRGKLSHSLAEKVKLIPNIEEELLSHVFCEVFHLSEDVVSQRLDRINKFINNIVDVGINPRVGAVYQRDLVSQITDISGAQLGRLLSYAFSLENPSWGDEAGSGKDALLMKKRIVFEARRKLTLLFLFSEVDQSYAEVIKKGNEPIEKLVQGFLTLPQVRGEIVSLGNERGEIENILVNPKEKSFRESAVIKKQETRFRRFKPGTRGIPFLVGNEVRTKQMDSVYRKVIVRGINDPKDIKDIYGRAFTIAPDQENPLSKKYVSQREIRSLMIDGKLQNVNDFAPILDILEYYQNQPNVRVFQYKATPELGENTKSSGVGGGEIRAAKFYIEHTDEKGITRFEEIQIFSSSEDGKSALYWQSKKKEDDERYFLDRMLDTKGLRSFLELMFPTAIYGEPIHAMIQDKKTRKAKKLK